MNIYPKNIFKRKTRLFFAVFISLLFFTISCKKKVNAVGEGILSQEDIMHSEGVDTFRINSYTLKEDTVNTMDAEFNLLGSYTDPVFGTVDASFYTQFTLSGFSPDFGEMTQLSIDSAVMAFEYGGIYGNSDAQLFEVYEITEDLTRDSSYSMRSLVQTSTQNLVPTANNEGLITPNTDKLAVVGNDTLNPQLRIPLDTTFARNLLVLAESTANDEDFLNQFKGLYFKVNNPISFPGEGGVIYLASSKPASKLTVYYTDHEGKSNKFDFIITGKAIDFNHIETDYTNTRVEEVIQNNALGNKEFYAQAFSSRAKIDFNSINDLPRDIIIHKATLEIPVNYYEGDKFYISNEINVSAQLFEGDDKKYFISTVPFNKLKKSYTIDLRTYVQNILKGDIENNGIFVSPKRFNTSMERIIFNGTESDFKKHPKLNIIFTKL